MGAAESTGALHAIMLGNPGAGKSTLMNCLSGGQAKFSSGYSYGSGMTKHLEMAAVRMDDADGTIVQFMDVPGLADRALRTQAAEAIHQGLSRKNERFKVLFVIKLDEGRVVSQDVTTMKLVLNSCPDIGSDYGIIINKLSKRAYKDLKAKAEAYFAVMAQLVMDLSDSDGKSPCCSLGGQSVIPTHHVFLMPRVEDLDEVDDTWVLLEKHDEFMEWVLKVPDVEVKQEVEMIDTSVFEAMNAALSKQLEDLTRDHEMAKRSLQAAEEKRRYESQRAAEELATLKAYLVQQRDEVLLQQKDLHEKFNQSQSEQAQVLKKMEEVNASQLVALQRKEERLMKKMADNTAKEIAGAVTTGGVLVSRIILEAKKQNRDLDGRTLGGDIESPWFAEDVGGWFGTVIDGARWTVEPNSALVGGALKLRKDRTAATRALNVFHKASFTVGATRIGFGTLTGAVTHIGNLTADVEDRLVVCLADDDITDKAARDLVTYSIRVSVYGQRIFGAAESSANIALVT